MPLIVSRVRRFLAVQLDHQPQFVHRVGVAQRILVADLAVFVQVEQVLVEGLHAHLARLGHDALDLVHLAFENHVRDQWRIEQDLHRGSAALAVLLRYQPLRHQRADVQRQIHQQLLFTLFREEVDDPVDRLIGTVGMQGRHAQMARLGECNRVIHGLAVANLADQDHIGRLTQRVFQRSVPGFGIDTDFALGDHAILVVMHVFDRILNSHDMTVAVFVAVADHRRQRG